MHIHIRDIAEKTPQGCASQTESSLPAEAEGKLGVQGGKE